MLRSALKRSASFSICVAIGIALLLSTVFTLWNWIENPGGIFRGSAGTSWNFVYDTAASWFVPTLLYTLPLAFVLHLLVSGLRASRRGNRAAPGEGIEDA